MKLIKIKITPKSSFASFPKGDMIFGHFANFMFKQNDKNLENYIHEEPKIIFSDFLPENYLYKPNLLLESFGVEDSDKKEFRKKAWIKIDNLQNGDLTECESLSFYKEEAIIRNSLNRLTFSTDDSGIFAPYSISELKFLYQSVIYVMFDKESFEQNKILEALNLIGRSGFGKKSSIGKGQFEAQIDEKFNGFKNIESNYYLTLSPTILNSQKDIIKDAYYNTFNRFGKYSNSNSPFKKPLLMTDSGAVIELSQKREFIGRAIDNGINENNKSFVQGYSILVPFKFDGQGIKNVSR